MCADLGRDRCFQGSHVLTPPSSPTSYQTLFGVVHTGYLTADSDVLRVGISKVSPVNAICKIADLQGEDAGSYSLLRYPADLAGQMGRPRLLLRDWSGRVDGVLRRECGTARMWKNGAASRDHTTQACRVWTSKKAKGGGRRRRRRTAPEGSRRI